MSIVLTEEQTMLRDMVSRFFAENYDFDTRRKIVNGGGAWRPEIWQAIAELGLLGAGLPEELGGLGGGAVEHMLIMEQIGAALALEPYLATAVIGGSILKHVPIDRAGELATGIVAGNFRLALAQAEPQARYNLAAVETRAESAGRGYVLNGFKSVIAGAAHATHFVVSARTGGASRDREGICLFLVPADATGIGRRDYALVDGHGASDVTFTGVEVPATALIGEPGKGLALIEEATDAAIAAICAEAIGVMRRLLADTVTYAKERKQFGRTLGEFQVLQHRMVDMLIEVEEATSMTHLATLAQAWPADERAQAVSAAKVRVGKACRFVGQNAVQLHGAIGTTDELALSHYFGRAAILENMFGSVDHHLARFARGMSVCPGSSEERA
jgi:alkylation response protein AidB-like acyl-CoA dehydrogenase